MSGSGVGVRICQVIFILSSTDAAEPGQGDLWIAYCESISVPCSASVFELAKRGGVPAAEDEGGGGWGVIGSWLSPQTGSPVCRIKGTGFQFSKPHHTSDAINKVSSPNTAREKCKSAPI